jgi:pimeloyl-ACP methyl ester carboxylesterase
VVHADGPQDNVEDKVRPVPPRGIQVPAEVRAELTAGVESLGQKIEALKSDPAATPALLELLPDVQIYYNAVRYALAYNEFFKKTEIPVAMKLLEQGHRRARLLRSGEAPWTSTTGLVVRGYVSKIDSSVQPYGLVVPSSYKPGTPYRHRLDIWFHGRGETLSEINFINDRQNNPGQFTPPHAFVLHPYGRYCNANHFAGEVDTFEALAHVKKHYAIDDNRLAVRGFSMGGAACWHFAVHHAGMWAAAAPGAGFSETPDFLRVFQKEKLQPAWYEQRLWHMYDCTDYAINLFQCPVVAYSGEKDSQKQAADLMERAMKAEGMSLVHIIGPGTGHSYHPAARKEIDRRIDAIMERGRDPVPSRIRFTTYTLRYNRMLWVTIDGLEKHWERARVDATLPPPNAAWNPYVPVNPYTPVTPDLVVQTKNVNALTLFMPPGSCTLDALRKPKVILDGRAVEAAPVLSDRSWTAHFRKTVKGWSAVASSDDGVLRKQHGLQGPIDDAFMDRFFMVRPTGRPLNDKVGRWTAAEMAHAIHHWRQQFRGEAPVKDDTEVSDADIAAANLVLWGDPSSNKIITRIAGKLPIVWSERGVVVGGKTFAADHHVPVLIFPNPLNPRRYVVINSGFTFREYDYLNNARQVPKLPDYAILDVDQPGTSRRPAGIVSAGFFTERWQLPAQSN